MNNSKILVTYGNVYDMKDDSGSRVCGTSLQYFFLGDDLKLFDSKAVESGKAGGVQRAKCSLPIEHMRKIPFVPGIYDADFDMSIGSDGKPVLKVSDLTFVAKCELKVIPMTSSK